MARSSSSIVLSLVTLLVASCGSDTASRDDRGSAVFERDGAVSSDADPRDVRSFDAGALDTGAPDSAALDALDLDALALDAFATRDAEPEDAGAPVDSGGGEGRDASGSPDAPPPSRDAAIADAWSCDPNAMPLPNAGLLEEPGTGGCPSGMVRIDSFCIDRFEGSLDGWSPYWNPGSRQIRAVSARGAVPQGYISGQQAARACTEAGKRLCTDQEWLRACRGPSQTTYPYGNTRMPGVCNDARSRHPAIEYFGSSDPSIWSMLGHPCINQLPASLLRTGEKTGCVTAEGVHDMMGNLHEWTADPAGTFRGGFYVDTRINGEGCLYRTTAHDVGHWDYSTGFRCCL